MSQLIDALLSLAQVGRGELQPIDLDFSYLVQSVAGELAAANPERSVAITIAPRMRAYGDPRLLRIVVANLLENAWKFTGRREQPAVEVGLRKNTKVPTYFVRDNGAGFDPEYASRLFGAFQRLHSDRDFPGTGIGLAIVHRVIARHGGHGLGGIAAGAGRDVLFHAAEEVRLKPDPQEEVTRSIRAVGQALA